MIFNGHNLEIAKFAGAYEAQGFNLNTLQVANQGTSVTDGYLLIRVSPIPGRNSEPIESFLLDASTTSVFTDDSFDSEALTVFNRIEGKIVNPETVTPKSDPQFTFKVRASLLLRAALSALMFADKKDVSINIAVHKGSEPIRMTAKNEQTGQKWLGLVMSTLDNGVSKLLDTHTESAHNAVINDAETMDDFQAAIRAAELLG